MTVAALKACLKVKIVTERGIGIKADILHRMAFCAGSGHRESSLAVMAAAAGAPTLHLLHGDMGVALVSLEQL